ncbi:hypothetical protein [Demequina sp. NBRC 110054]|uniref:hypothetical protein n=1 Tax=Demequina sp. NBRC 110054 TaxID=1570343 RepID=UPI001177B027|nr:hypothetical protein [Demequina sp. NBRC 110054]
MRRIARTAAAAALAIGLTVTGAAVASASDDGDGLEGCNSGELCLSTANNGRYQKHFYDAGWETNYYYWDKTNNVRTSKAVSNNADWVRNRTGEKVKIVDDHGLMPDEVFVVTAATTSWVEISDTGVANGNDRHEIGSDK